MTNNFSDVWAHVHTNDPQIGNGHDYISDGDWDVLYVLNNNQRRMGLANKRSKTWCPTGNLDMFHHIHQAEIQGIFTDYDAMC